MSEGVVREELEFAKDSIRRLVNHALARTEPGGSFPFLSITCGLPDERNVTSGQEALGSAGVEALRNEDTVGIAAAVAGHVAKCGAQTMGLLIPSWAALLKPMTEAEVRELRDISAWAPAEAEARGMVPCVIGLVSDGEVLHSLVYDLARRPDGGLRLSEHNEGKLPSTWEVGLQLGVATGRTMLGDRRYAESAKREIDAKLRAVFFPESR